MRKLVFGIIVIACLDLGFIAYTFVVFSFRSDVLAKAREAIHERFVVSRPLPEDIFSTPPADIVKSERVDRTAQRSMPLIARSRVYRRPKFRLLQEEIPSAAPLDMSTRVISYNGTAAPPSSFLLIEDASGTVIFYSQPKPAKPVEKPVVAPPPNKPAANLSKKDRYIARVFPTAVKKPWDVLKFVGSKLK